MFHINLCKIEDFFWFFLLHHSGKKLESLFVVTYHRYCFSFQILAFDYESKFIDLLLGHEKVLKRLGILETENENLRASVQDRQQQISFLKVRINRCIHKISLFIK